MSYSRDDIRIAAPNVSLDTLPGPHKPDCLLFYHPDTAELAQRVAAASPNIQLGEVKWA